MDILYYIHKSFNFLVKFLGFCFFIVGIPMTIGNAIFYLYLNNPINVNGQETDDIVFKLFSVVFPALFTMVGYMLIRAKGYYPWYINAYRKRNDK